MADPYDSKELHRRLSSAGLPVTGCNSRGEIFWASLPTAQQEALAEQIKSKLLSDMAAIRLDRQETLQKISGILDRMEAGGVPAPQELRILLLYLFGRIF